MRSTSTLDRHSRLSRREFLGISAASAAAALLSGCATNPVTGRKEFMIVSEEQEADMDAKWAPHQFSTDYGTLQDRDLNAYVSALGSELGAVSHRTSMPYTFRVLNTPVVNAYTFPAGSVGIARGLMLEMESEAELAAVLGHELGHVNARHTASQMSRGIVAQLAVAGLAAYVQQEQEKYADLAAGLGMIGSQMLLCRYSRDNEREADALGMEYMAAIRRNPRGMAGVMETFMRLHRDKPGAVELLFATHPLSEDRHRTALEFMKTKYAQAGEFPENRDRYMDHTARLRTMKAAIENMQKGERAMMGGKLADAATCFAAALKDGPDDYAALLMQAKCHLAQKQYARSLELAERARGVYSEEPQAWHLCGIAKGRLGRYDAAVDDFKRYEEKLPGNPNTVFFLGYCDEQTGKKDAAATEYRRYLAEAPSGEYARYVQNRLTQWGYVQPVSPK